jgi:hypothetical protein
MTAYCIRSSLPTRPTDWNIRTVDLAEIVGTAKIVDRETETSGSPGAIFPVPHFVYDSNVRGGSPARSRVHGLGHVSSMGMKRAIAGSVSCGH